MIGTADPIIEKMRAYSGAVDARRLTRAFEFGKRAHHGQMRASGEPYFTHPVAVANILVDMRLDEESIITALLHDTVEDCEVTLDTLHAEFGGDVAQLVDGVTKLSRLAIRTLPSSAQAENFRKLLMAMSEDVRVLMVKLADRTHNMRTLSFIPKPEKRQRIARETMDIYAPLAERIGLTQLQTELEDSAFEILNGDMRQSILTRLEFLTSEAKLTIPTISVELQSTIERAGIECSVTGRLKSPYSIWRKMQTKAVTMDQLADIVAFRVLVPTMDDCYRALGQLHQNYPTVMGRFKDYISTPKRNGYQSLHTGMFWDRRTTGLRSRSGRRKCMTWPRTALPRIGITSVQTRIIIRQNTNGFRSLLVFLTRRRGLMNFSNIPRWTCITIRCSASRPAEI